MDAWFPWWATTIGLAVVVLGWDFRRMRRNPAARAPALWWIGQLGITVVLGAACWHDGSGGEFLAEWADSWSRCLDLVVLLVVGSTAAAETVKLNAVLLAVCCALALRAAHAFSAAGGRWPVALFGVAVLGAGWWWFRRAEHSDGSPVRPPPWLAPAWSVAAGAVFALSASPGSPEHGAVMFCAAVPALLGARAAFGVADRALARMPAIVFAALPAFIGVKAVLIGVLAPPGTRIELAALSVFVAGAVFALGAITADRVPAPRE